LKKTIYSFIRSLEKEIPGFQNSPKNWGNLYGNVAICIISEEWQSLMESLFGTDKIEQRENL